MVVKFGQVTTYDPVTQLAVITYSRPDACAKCGACGHMDQQGSIRLKADCAVGDWVRVVFPDQKFVGAAALAYGLPLALLLLGLAVGCALSAGRDVGLLRGAAAGLLAGVLCLRLCEKRLAGRADWAPRVDAVYSHKPNQTDIGCGA